ncbi:MAG: UDP-glucose 4-epimerase GalE [Cytophagales bacterium]|nr:MAG: UDP-glucose 4-epimerase GalE [Cytophagales bacterium]
MKTLFVTGGMGYIGSHTIIELSQKTDFQIVSIDNFSNASPQTLVRLKHILGKDIINENVDLCQENALEAVFTKYEQVVGIIHFAALKSVPDSVADPLFYYQNNVMGLINLLRMTAKYHIKNFIFSSSCAIYGTVSTLPVNEETPQNPTQSPYAQTKVVCERIIQDFLAASNATNCIFLRYFNPVGAHQSGLIGEDPTNKPTNLLPLLTRTAAGLQEKLLVFGSDYPTRDGSCVRDYVHVSDIANAHVLALQYALKKPDMGLEVFNLGSGQGVSVLEAIHAFERVVGISVRHELVARRVGDLAAIFSDSGRAAKLLGWHCERTLDDMLLSAWEWQKTLLKQ